MIAETRRHGIEPTEVWLGRRELEIFDAAEASSNACCYTSVQRQICGLMARRSHEDEIREGVTVGQRSRALSPDGEHVSIAE